MKETKTSVWIVMLTVAAALLVTLLDVAWPSSTIAWHGLFAIPVVWIALWSAEDDITPIAAVAIIVTALVLMHGLVSRDTFIFGDRLTVIVTVWATLILALFRKRARRTFKWINLAGRR